MPTRAISAIEVERLADLADAMGWDTVAELVELFIEASGQSVQAICAALAAGDLIAAGKEAHTLKGSSSNVGAVTLQAVCQSLLEACHGDELAAAAPLSSRSRPRQPPRSTAAPCGQ